MRANARFWTGRRWVEVAPHRRLRPCILDGLRRYGELTSVEVASLAFWGRCPHKSRLGSQWQANASMRTSTRRALACLVRSGRITITGRMGREKLYAFSGNRLFQDELERADVNEVAARAEAQTSAFMRSRNAPR